MADRFPEGWGQGLEPKGPGPALAVKDSNAKFNLSACSIHEQQASPGEQGTGKGQTSQGAGQGRQVFPRAKEESQPQARGGESGTNNRRSEMPEVSEHLQLDNQSGLPLVRLQASPGNVPKAPPSQKSAGPASVKTGGGGSSSGASSGTSYASVVKGETGPAETTKEEKGIQQRKAETPEKVIATLAEDDPLREDFESQLEQPRAALKDPRNPGARLDSAMAKMRKAKAKVQKREEQLRQAEASLKSAHAEEEEASSELKAAQENAVPKQPELPPGDAAMQLSSEDITDLTDVLKQCGLLAVAACEDASEAQAKKARKGPYDNPRKTPREIAKLANPALVARLANSVHILEEAVKSGGDGSLEDTSIGDLEALRGLSPPPPPPNPAALAPPVPPENPPGGQTHPKDTVKDTETQSQSQQDAQAESPLHSQERETTLRSAPGDALLEPQGQLVPLLWCSEHSTASSRVSTQLHECPCPTEDLRYDFEEGSQANVSYEQMIPGILSSCLVAHSVPVQLSMHLRVPGTVSICCGACPGRNMSDMSHALELEAYLCSHVGYIPDDSRLETCPGQCAQQHRSRLEKLAPARVPDSRKAGN